MPAVRLAGHSHAYPAADVLRLFCGPLAVSEPPLLLAGLPEPLIESTLEPGAGQTVRIRTAWDGWRCENEVALPLAKREIKRQLYLALSAWSGYHFPWGSLTGIRPTLIAAECLTHGGSPENAIEELTGRYLVSPEKASLALETLPAEQALLRQIPADSRLVYVHVPFCPSRCTYCSFITQDAPRRAALLEPYVAAVLQETAALFRPPGPPVAAVYFGGGTPTSLPDPLFGRLLCGVLGQLPLCDPCEVTVEAGRPDTISPAKLAACRAAGVSRLCVNPQTFHDCTLQRIGRAHTAEQAREAFRLARGMDFSDLNMDLIAGLPGESPDDFAQSLNQAVGLGPDSITVHSLALKRSARLRQQTAPDDARLICRPDPALEEMLARARRLLADSGYRPYYLYRQKDTAGGLENTGFSKPGAGGLYNVGMMSDRYPVVGLGSGAMSKTVCGSRIERLANPRDIAAYISRLDAIGERKRRFFLGNDCSPKNWG
jgi:oxygen-independent coproporphyrinogen-3 oxidase